MRLLLSNKSDSMCLPTTTSIRLAMARISRGLDKAIAAFLATQAVRCTEAELVIRSVGLSRQQKQTLHMRDTLHSSSSRRADMLVLQTRRMLIAQRPVVSIGIGS